MVVHLVQILSTDILSSMFESYMRDTPGIFEIITTDTHEYLFRSRDRERSPSFCRVLRNLPGGESICATCHQKGLTRTREGIVPKSNVYLCDAGLLEVVIPIVVQKEIVAAIFWGQLRPLDSGEEKVAAALTAKVETDLIQPRGTLVTLRERLPIVEPKELEDGKRKLEMIATHISDLVHKRLAVQEEELRVREAIRSLNSAETLDEFWRRMPKVMEDLCNVIGAVAGALIMYERKHGTRELHPLAKVVTPLLSSLKDKTYIENNLEIQKALRRMESEVIPFNLTSRPGTLCRDVGQLPELRGKIDKVALIPLRLDKYYDGAIVFFMNVQDDTASSLPIERELLDIFKPIPELIVTAYRHCQLSSMRGDWLKTVMHQLLAPLTGIQGHSETLARWFDPWAHELESLIERAGEDSSWGEEKISMGIPAKQLSSMLNTLDSILWMTAAVSRMTRNFAWIADIEKPKEQIRVNPVRSTTGLLISYAKKVQGLAKQRHLRRVHVDEESVELLDGRIHINNDLFSQAIGNLLDNAVKYADKNTDVVLWASIEGEYGVIHITNRGIPIHEDEVERIFNGNFRTEAAKARQTVGTGIGLRIAQNMLELHYGKITVAPSRPINEQNYSGYETTFNVWLPLDGPKKK